MGFGNYPKRDCRVLEPTSNVVRCQLYKGHRGLHLAELNGNRYEWGEDYSDARPQRQAVNGTIPTESPEHAVAEIFTDGIKAAHLSTELLATGEVRCPICNIAKVKISAETRNLMRSGHEDAFRLPLPAEYVIAMEEAMLRFAKHHIARRSSHGYRPKVRGHRFGHDDPFLIGTPCNDCHTGPDSELHPGPQFSRSGGQ